MFNKMARDVFNKFNIYVLGFKFQHYKSKLRFSIYNYLVEIFAEISIVCFEFLPSNFAAKVLAWKKRIRGVFTMIGPWAGAANFRYL